MSVRTPGIQPRSQYHSYWGRYAYAVGAGVWANGSNLLPGAPGNVIAANEFAKLEVGDIAATQDALVANQDLYVCVDVSGGNGLVEWRRLGNAGLATQTVRDAHVIVVAQNGFVLVAGSPPPYNLTDGAGVLADYIDTGNGAQLALALLAAAAASAPVDVRLRPCYLDLGAAGAPAVPLTVPTSCRLLGAGRWISQIQSKSAAAASQEVLVLAGTAELIDIGIFSPAQAAPGVGTSNAIVRASGTSTRVKDCRVSWKGATRTQPWAIWDTSGTIEVIGCSFDGDDGGTSAAETIGVVVGDPTVAASWTAPASEYEISGCRFENGNHFLYSYNCIGGSVSDCVVAAVRPIAGALKLAYAGVPLSAPGVLPRLDDIRITVAVTEQVGDPFYAGVDLGNNITETLSGLMWTGVEVIFAASELLAIPRLGFRVHGVGDNGRIDGGTIVGCQSIGHSTGFELDAAGAGAGTAITDIAITGCVAKEPKAIGADVGHGFRLTATAPGSITSVNVNAGNARRAPLGAYGLRIETAAVTNTIATANQLGPNGGAAISDVGTGTEAAHNILV